jgi:hypothetical protein
MKDEKGHGSDAHSTGVQEVGQPNVLRVRSAGGWVDLNRDGVQRVSDRQTYRVIPSELPGLSYVRTNSGGSKSYSLYHEGSGRIMGDWDNRRTGPNWSGSKLDTGKVDTNLRSLGVDWTKPDVESHPNFNATMVRRAMYGKD